MFNKERKKYEELSRRIDETLQKRKQEDPTFCTECVNQREIVGENGEVYKCPVCRPEGDDNE